MGTYYTEKEVLQDFYSYWEKIYPPLEDFHRNWLAKNAQILRVKKGQVLYESDDQQENLYIVLRGLLVKERYTSCSDNKQILTVALPNMGFFTTMHYYSKSPALGDIVAVRPGIVLQIPYKKIKPYRNNDKGIDTLLQLLMHKKKYQLEHLRAMDGITLTTDRLFYLADNLPDLYRNLSRQELARLILASESSIYRANRILARRKN
ncbi:MULTISPECIES: Crp/Fnr family transcriptional regulator [unclassified Sphingobacterium]|uniref:Crp/Fnr family transcriptional regulator n=1 Tax=unclassified Sphingobacterium TaxID=2609468 RepID=UPI001049E789|nr:MULTISPECIES: cyclic nucleotide-binding domain-containing protein [unclassified Sphingobacterium]MCS3556203.1 CRP-like cAMP-binding protein [Sphingobacterium sp. JUb21]TCR08577.1 CRP-like cAMP-binding protein [Sphingobacterium sp. JUb20]